MKTIPKTLALLFTAAAYTACTNATIEPVRPAAQPSIVVARPDTTAGLPVDQLAIDDELPAKNRHKTAPINEEVHLNGQQPIVTPTQPTPRPTMQPTTKHPKPILTDAPAANDALAY